MNYTESFLSRREKAAMHLRGLFEQHGYRMYHMSSFEEYSLYLDNRNFLTSEQVITFTDLDGKLLALKPDVTLSIAKNVASSSDDITKYYYVENVYRPSRESHTFREINQMGVECIGNLDQLQIAEVVGMARDTLLGMGVAYILELSHMGFIKGLYDAIGIPQMERDKVDQAVSQKNVPALFKMLDEFGLGEYAKNLISQAVMMSGPAKDVLAQAEKICINADMNQAVNTLKSIVNLIGDEDGVQIDFSQIEDDSYYNGITMRGYLENIPSYVLSGGEYGGLLERLNRDCGAIGFALYLDEIDRLPDEPDAKKTTLLLYKEEDDCCEVLKKADQLRASGRRVRISKTIDADCCGAEIITFA